MTTSRRLFTRLAGIGWNRPLGIARYLGFEVVLRVRRRLLARAYRIVVGHSRATGLDAPAVTLPPFEQLPAALQPAAAALRDFAEETLVHRFDLLGSGPIPLGERIDWHCDFKSGYVWPLVPYLDVVVTRLDDDSDAKVPWELSRSHHLVGLARAAVLFRDERYAQELERQLGEWLAANPPGFGINWTNPMETAIRAINWVWAIGTLEQWRSLDARLRRRVSRSLGIHARHIMANLEGSPFLRSNHYTADVLGLLVLGHFLRGDWAKLRWRAYATRALRREAGRQILDDGVGFEASLPYHCLVLEMFLIAAYTARTCGCPFDAATESRIAEMSDVVRAVRHPDGRLPQFGDCDSGRILPAGPGRGPQQDHLLWLAAAVLDRPAPLPGEPSAEVAWTLGIDAWSRLRERPAVKHHPRRAFPQGGLYVLANTRLHAVVRCGDVGQKGNGGHAHNDLLTYELSSTGIPLVVDPGTFLYTSDPAARNAFRSTRAHNVLQVANEELNPIDPGRLFALDQVATPRVLQFEVGLGTSRLRATHDGWWRLRPPVLHVRDFLLHDEGVLTIRDEIAGRGGQPMAIRTHLAPDVAVAAGDRPGEFILRVGTHDVRLQFDAAWLSLEVAEGWVSDRFGVRQAASVIVARARVCERHVLEHRFTYVR